MKLREASMRLAASVLALFVMTGVARAADRPYTEGVVLNVQAIRTEPGMFDTYMEYLAGTYRKVMEEQKAAGIIVDYHVYSAVPRGPNDPDIFLITTYKNMAAFDGLNAKTDPIQQKFFGDIAQRGAATKERGKMRTALGSELVRKLDLK